MRAAGLLALVAFALALDCIGIWLGFSGVFAEPAGSKLGECLVAGIPVVTLGVALTTMGSVLLAVSCVSMKDSVLGPATSVIVAKTICGFLSAMTGVAAMAVSFLGIASWVAGAALLVLGLRDSNLQFALCSMPYFCEGFCLAVVVMCRPRGLEFRPR